MKNFSKEWTEPTFTFSSVVFIIIFHIACFIGLLSWAIAYVLNKDTSFFVLLLVFIATIIMNYTFLSVVNQDAMKSEFQLLHNLTVRLAKMFDSLELVAKVLFCQPPGSAWRGRQEEASPLRLFFTDQTKVSASAGGENSVIQMVGSLYDSIENTYGKITTRLYRAFQPSPVGSSAGLTLKKFCCVPYAIIYLFSLILLLVEIILIV